MNTTSTIQPALRRFHQRIPAVILAALIGFGFAPGLRADGTFILPNLEARLFEGKNLDFGKRGQFDRVGTVSALARIAAEFDEDDDVPNELRSHALGIAGMMDPKNKTFQSALGDLKRSPKASEGRKSTKARLIGNITDGVETLLKDKDNGDNRKCAAYCVDIALRLDPNDERHAEKLKTLRDEFKNTDIVLDWGKIQGKRRGKIPGKSVPRPGPVPPNFPWPFPPRQIPMKAREVPMPGGTANGFAIPQSTVSGLVVRTLNGGKHAGGASQITATALEENVKELQFTIDQKVGEAMGNSLDSIIQFMRVKYGKGPKVPKGYKISIVFEDRDTLADGPSAGIAMALMIDALFSGSKVDPGFACTGGITPNGSVTKIGGVAAKIRGATHRDRRIVGVPEGNADGVNDILVLGGIQPLLDIQVFTMKNFDEAFVISRAEKDAKVAGVLAAFDEVSDVIARRGEGILKHSVVQKKLQDVLVAMPNHMSARLLLDHANGRGSHKLSAGGSFHEIRSRASGLLSRREIMMMIRGGKYVHSEPLVAEAAESLKELRKLQAHVHDKFDAYLQSNIRICEMVENGRGGQDEKEYVKSLRQAFSALETLFKKLKSDPEILEESMG